MEREIIYSDKYMDVYYIRSLELLEEYWKEETEDMTDATYRVITLNLMEKFEREKIVIRRLLLDNRKFLFTMPPALQDWQKEEVFSKLGGLGTQKIAVIMSQEFVSQMSIEQTMDENEDMSILTQYFSDTEEAKEWLLNKEQVV